MDPGCLRVRSLLLFLGECPLPPRRAALPTPGLGQAGPGEDRAPSLGTGASSSCQKLWQNRNFHSPSGEANMFVLRDEVTGRDGCTWAAVGVEEWSLQVFLCVLLLWDVLLLVQCPGVPRDRAKVTVHCPSPQLCSRCSLLKGLQSVLFLLDLSSLVLLPGAG